MKKILYTIIVIAVIIVLSVMWTNNKNNKVEAPIITNQEQVSDNSDSTSSEVDTISVDSGINADLNSIDADLSTL